MECPARRGCGDSASVDLRVMKGEEGEELQGVAEEEQRQQQQGACDGVRSGAKGAPEGNEHADQADTAMVVSDACSPHRDQHAAAIEDWLAGCPASISTRAVDAVCLVLGFTDCGKIDLRTVGGPVPSMWRRVRLRSIGSTRRALTRVRFKGRKFVQRVGECEAPRGAMVISLQSGGEARVC